MYTPNLVDSMLSPEKIFEKNYKRLAEHDPAKAAAYEKAVLKKLGFSAIKHADSATIVAREAPNYPARHIGKDVKDMLRLEYQIAKFAPAS